MGVYQPPKKFSNWKAFRKGLGSALGAYFVGHMAGVDLGKILADPGEQIPVIASTLLAGLIPVVINTWKNRKLDGNPLSKLTLLLALGLAGMSLQGCITTTGPDGTTTTQLDGAALETAWSTWERYEARKALLEKEKAAARAAQDAQRLAIIESELEKLEPKINELADRLGL